MKILEDKYPKGSLPKQQTDGRYISQYLYENLKGLAEVIKKDMTFLGIGFSSTLEVGTGKSVLFTQIGEAWSYLMKKIYGDDIPFTSKNIVWRPKELIKRSFELPKYSCVLLDEWEDAHYWSELGMTLRQFFRKCRQLNLFILVIIPNFFQMNINYATGRSVFAIDVKFTGKFERGTASFYNFDAKRELYIKGKKTQNYNVVKPTFTFSFTDGYGVPEGEYRKAKEDDLKKWDEDEKIITDPRMVAHDVRAKTYAVFYRNKDLIQKKGISHILLGELFGVNESTCREWLNYAEKNIPFVIGARGEYIKDTTKRKILPDNSSKNDEKEEETEET